MSRRATDTLLDPALAVSGLLTRVGLFLLVVLTPLLAMVTRRGVSVLVPVATALLIIAAGLDGRLSLALARFGRIILRPASLVLLALLGWAGLSLGWTPRAGMAPHLVVILLILALFVGAIACLGERVRGSDVNLIPLGVAFAAVVLALEVAFLAPPATAVEAASRALSTQRAAMLIALLAWPATTALLLRGRRGLAGVLALVVLATLWMVHDLVVLAAFLAGVLVFIVATRRPSWGRPLVGGAGLGLLLLAPPIGWLMAQYGGWLLPHAGDELVAIWRDVTHSLTIRPVLGFGFDASLALARGPGGALLGSPRNAALQVWLELGTVGVVLAGLAIVLGSAAVERLAPRARPPVLAVMGVVLVMMFAGLASWQIWWVMALGLTAVSLAFVSRRASQES